MIVEAFSGTQAGLSALAAKNGIGAKSELQAAAQVGVHRVYFIADGCDFIRQVLLIQRNGIHLCSGTWRICRSSGGVDVACVCLLWLQRSPSLACLFGQLVSCGMKVADHLDKKLQDLASCQRKAFLADVLAFGQWLNRM